MQNDRYSVSLGILANVFAIFVFVQDYNILRVTSFCFNNLEMYTTQPKSWTLYKNCENCSIELFRPELVHIDIEPQKSLNVN